MVARTCIKIHLVPTSITLAQEPHYLLRAAAATDSRIFDSGDTRAASSRLISGVRRVVSVLEKNIRESPAGKLRGEHVTLYSSSSYFAIHSIRINPRYDAIARLTLIDPDDTGSYLVLFGGAEFNRGQKVIGSWGRVICTANTREKPWSLRSARDLI